MSITNITIAVIGTVSSGKSTLLNSLFLEEFTSMDISRNTMIPQIYHELENNKTKIVKEAKQINKEISEKNKEIKDKTNDPKYNIKDDMIPMEFYIHKLKEFKICKKDILMSFYDIPGLNDNKNHTEYYNYVKTNFDKFDVILYLVDLVHGLNTKDEIDLLNFVSKYAMRSNKFVIPIINKSDDMTMKDGAFECNPEYFKNYENIIQELNNFSIKYPNPKFQKPLLYSARESYTYRMLVKDPDFELSESIKDIIGFNEMGKRYYRLSKEERAIKFKEIVTNTDFLMTMIKMSGFYYLVDVLKDVLNETNQKNICEDKLISLYQNLNNITEINSNNIIKIFDEFTNICVGKNKFNNIFGCDTQIDENEFVNNKYDLMIANIDNKDIQNLMDLNKCLEIISTHEYNKYIGNKISNDIEKNKESIYNYYVEFYEPELSLGELIDILDKFKSHQIDKLDIYAKVYMDKIIQTQTNFYSDVDYTDFNSITKFDQKYKEELGKLKNYLNTPTIKQIYKFIVKNKIQNLTNSIEISQDNKQVCVIVLYNLMLFYNYYSTKEIEYSEIYTLLLSNYIRVLNSNDINMIKLEKLDHLLSIDSDYVEN